MIEGFIQQGQKLARGAAQRGQNRFLMGGRAVALEDPQQAGYSIHGRADLMAHHGQKIIAGAGGGFGFMAGRLEGGDIVAHFGRQPAEFLRQLADFIAWTGGRAGWDFLARFVVSHGIADVLQAARERATGQQDDACAADGGQAGQGQRPVASGGQSAEEFALPGGQPDFPQPAGPG